MTYLSNHDAMMRLVCILIYISKVLITRSVPLPVATSSYTTAFGRRMRPNINTKIQKPRSPPRPIPFNTPTPVTKSRRVAHISAQPQRNKSKGLDIYQLVPHTRLPELSRNKIPKKTDQPPAFSKYPVKNKKRYQNGITAAHPQPRPTSPCNQHCAQPASHSPDEQNHTLRPPRATLRASPSG